MSSQDWSHGPWFAKIEHCQNLPAWHKLLCVWSVVLLAKNMALVGHLGKATVRRIAIIVHGGAWDIPDALEVSELHWLLAMLFCTPRTQDLTCTCTHMVQRPTSAEACAKQAVRDYWRRVWHSRCS
jgi:hypothetical protein